MIELGEAPKDTPRQIVIQLSIEGSSPLKPGDRVVGRKRNRAKVMIVTSTMYFIEGVAYIDTASKKGVRLKDVQKVQTRK